MKLERKPRVLGEERLRLIEVLRAELERDEAVVFAYLHGSLLEGGPARDVDVAVWLRGGVDPLDYVLRRGLELELTLGVPVDLQVLNGAPVVFRRHVYARGPPLLVRDRALHDLEVARTALEYADLKLLARLARGGARPRGPLRRLGGGGRPGPAPPGP